MPRLFAALAVASLISACAYPYNIVTRAADGATIAMNPTQTAALADGALLRYTRLVSDARCPPDVQCVWAGDAVIELHWTPVTGTPRTLTLHLNPQAGPQTAKLDTRKVTFTYLGRPQPQASLHVERAD